MIGVDRRVERRELVAHGELVAMLRDELADVVALERDRKARKRTGHRRAGGEGLGVAVDGHRLVVSGDHHHVVVGLSPDRALGADGFEVRIGVDDHGVVPEEVDGFVVLSLIVS